MKVNFNTYSTNYYAQKSSPSFGLIRLINTNEQESIDDALERLLTKRQYKSLMATVENHNANDNESNKYVTLDIFVKDNELSATYTDNSHYVNTSDWRVKDGHQYWFESSNHFLNRMLKKMNNRTEEIKRMVDQKVS